MSEFDPSRYGPVFEPLLSIDRNRALDEGVPNKAVRDQLDAMTVPNAFAHAKVLDPTMARACLSGVWLLHDFLDESHSISQAIDTPEGSFWHGIMHRREGDFSNSKYWFRMTGDHPVFEELSEACDHWDPYEFVDQCKAAIRSTDDSGCRRLQQAEWEHLFDYCYRHAVSGE